MQEEAVVGKRVARGTAGAGAAASADPFADFQADAVAKDGGQQGKTGPFLRFMLSVLGQQRCPSPWGIAVEMERFF